ncbi:CLUMA_CG008193, isoform A [Clunio marinus]|uniref:CLUMA_CG008193, isoform A n=1 Tax=Clunio marinus TaxID=568069 RepID=A0A1J1I331_9DIPT|nr:CLUMA_CG008193, isoform A [Clunio marinus]
MFSIQQFYCMKFRSSNNVDVIIETLLVIPLKGKLKGMFSFQSKFETQNWKFCFIQHAKVMKQKAKMIVECHLNTRHKTPSVLPQENQITPKA